MNYIHNPYLYGPPFAHPFQAQARPLGYGLPIPADYITPPDNYFPYVQPIEGQPIYHAVPVEDAENLSRPRLTKEQVGILEAQFQAHPKPNSKTKRQLAGQTNLTLPRVANWFQNRRAKAKQQRRQEQYEKKLAEEEKAEGGRAAAPPGIAGDRDDKPEAGATANRENTSSSSPSRLGPQSSSSSAAAAATSSTYFADRTSSRGGQQPPRLAHSKSAEFGDTGISAASLPGPSAKRETSTNSSSAYYSSVSPSISGAAEQQPYPQWANPSSTAHQPDATGPRECNFDTEVDNSNASGNSGMPLPAGTNSQSPHLSVTNTPVITTTATTGLPEGASSTPSTSTTKKKMDIAKRRKRPRPADIGTSNKDVQYLRGPASAQSPRVMSSLGSHGITKPLRQVKSSHTLGIDYNRRHNVGVRDISAQRSPYSLSSFVESPFLNSSVDYLGSVPPSTANSLAFSQTLDTPSSTTFSPISSSQTLMNIDPYDSKPPGHQTPTSVAPDFMPSYTWPTATSSHGITDPVNPALSGGEDAFSHPSNSFMQPPPADDFKPLDCPIIPPSASSQWMNPSDPAIAAMPSPAAKLEDSSLSYLVPPPPLEGYDFPSSQLLNGGLSAHNPDAFPGETTTTTITTTSSPAAGPEVAHVPPMSVLNNPSSKQPWFDQSAPFMLPDDQDSFDIGHVSSF